MSEVNRALRSIINGKKDFCCLCLKPNQVETISVDDEITVNINNNEINIDIAEVLGSVLGEETFNYITIFNTLCHQCIKSTITCYRFIQSSQKNVSNLTNVLASVANSFVYATDDVNDSKSLYVSLNLKDYTSKHIYDIKKEVSSRQAVLSRFLSLDNMEKNKMNNQHEIKNEEINYELPIDSQSFENESVSQIAIDTDDPKVFRSKENNFSFNQHYNKVHRSKKFQCPECSKRYCSATELRTHKMECHSCYVCSKCGKIFKNVTTLKMHEFSHKLTVVCPDCGRVYKNKYTFKKHIEFNVCGRESRAHPSEAKFTCDYCNKKYAQKVSLRVHIQYEHGNYKSHDCKWCGKKFWAPSRLKAHIVKHTHEKNFTCSFCDGKFVSKESLLYHTRIHTGEKPYKCPHCDCRFLSASRRSVHVKKHHNVDIHECDVCPSKLNSRQCLQKRKRIHEVSENRWNRSNSSKTSKPEHKTIIATKPSDSVELDELWKINDVSFQNILESGVVDMHNFKSEVIQLSQDNIYLEVPDDGDANEYTTITGI